MVSQTICPPLCGIKPAYKKPLKATLDSVAFGLASSTDRYFFFSPSKMQQGLMQQSTWPQNWEMLFPPQLTPSACQCKIMCCYCVGTGILASLFHTVVPDGSLVLQTSWEGLSQKRACVLQRQALITGAKCIAKTYRSTIFNNLETEYDSVHFYALFIPALESPHTCKAPLEQEFTGSKSQGCSLELLNHTTDFISGRSN